MYTYTYTRVERGMGFVLFFKGCWEGRGGGGWGSGREMKGREGDNKIFFF